MKHISHCSSVATYLCWAMLHVCKNKHYTRSHCLKNSTNFVKSIWTIFYYLTVICFDQIWSPSVNNVFIFKSE